MKLTTLCYIEASGCYLMLHRVKKENDANCGKWIGVGGKFEPGETPEECLLREVREETGLKLLRYRFRGIVTFTSDEWETEYMHLFTADKFAPDETALSRADGENPVACDGETAAGYAACAPVCSEGDLVWVPKSEIGGLNLWEGDRIFFRLLEEDRGFFSLKLRYERGQLAESVVRTYGQNCPYGG